MSPRDLQLYDNDRRLVVANSGSDTVSVVDIVNRKVLYDVPVPLQPYGVAIADGGKTALITGWRAAFARPVAGQHLGARRWIG